MSAEKHVPENVSTSELDEPDDASGRNLRLDRRKFVWLRGGIALALVLAVVLSLIFIRRGVLTRSPDLRPLLASAPAGSVACQADSIEDIGPDNRDDVRARLGSVAGPGLLSVSTRCWVAPSDPLSETEIVLLAFDNSSDAARSWATGLPELRQIAHATGSVALGGATGVETFMSTLAGPGEGQMWVVGLHGKTVFVMTAALTDSEDATVVNQIALDQYHLLVGQ